jgi:hypothetical protein
VADRGRLDTDAIAILTWLAGLVLDRMARRKLVPSPALREPEIAPSMTRDETPPSFAASPHPAERGERPLGGPLAPRGEDERREDARRFARLLASEIKLYNEREVSEGRNRGDLYERLKSDIDRGRRLYEERVPSEVREGKDYYYEELVDVLAGGRPEALR